MLINVNPFDDDVTWNLNIYDTYFVMEAIWAYFLIAILLFSTLYLIRVITNKFKNFLAILVYTVSNLLAICVLIKIYSFFEYSQMISNNPQGSTTGVDVWNTLKNTAMAIIAIFGILLCYSSYRLGKIDK